MDKPVAVVLSANGKRIEFDLNMISACQSSRGAGCVDETKEWVESVLAMEGRDRFDQHYQIKMPWPDALQDGVAFSSAAELDIDKAFRWHYRVDAEVADGILTFFVYKRIPQLMSYQDGSKWFEDDFRVEVLRRSRELKEEAPESDRE